LLTIVLAASELEKIPSSIFSHPAITSYANQRNKKPEQMILDSNYHHNAMKNLLEGDRRGRPDIVHMFLLTSLESIANKEGKLKVIVHTRNNEAVYVNPKTRIMRNYSRFIGLVEQIFEKKSITTQNETLIELHENITLDKIIKQEKTDVVIVFSPDGKKVKLTNFFKDIKKKKQENILCIIGGFPKGDFHFDFSKTSYNVVSIYDKPLTAWTVTGEVLVNYNLVF